MIERFIESNRFWHSIERFESEDKHLVDLQKYRYVYRYPWTLQITEPGVYLLFGGRQIGKTTSIKQFIQLKLSSGRIKPEQAFYLACDGIIDREDLTRTIRDFLTTINRKERFILALDEVTYLKGWELVVKSLIDEGCFGNGIVIITGSDRVVLTDAAAGFPGIDRRGKNGKDFVLHPLTFRENLELVDPSIIGALVRGDEDALEAAERKFAIYLHSGGYLNSINALAGDGVISPALYSVYEQWILSDFVRKGKDRRKLVDLLRVLVERRLSTLSFAKIAQAAVNLSIDSVIDYINHLERLEVIKVLYAFDQNSLTAAPKKEKKFHFCDPFLFRVLARWLEREGLLKADVVSDNSLVEMLTVMAYARTRPVYYIKADGEVDLVVVHGGKFDPIEIKWSHTLRTNELKQIQKYPNGTILCRQRAPGNINQLKIENLVRHLALLDGLKPD